MTDDLYVPPGHFYSPIPSEEDVREHLERFSKREHRAIAGITLDDQVLLATWNRLVPHMRQAPFQEFANAVYRYHWNNNFYSYGDASVYFGMLADLRPRQVIEIGSGFSSALALDARELLKLDAAFTFIDPQAQRLRRLLREGDGASTTIVEDKVQNVDLSLFEQLEANDILFIDSSHVLKTGSDVCFELFEILPQLAKGVVVHFHDVFYPFEYPAVWLNGNRAWNELYALRAFLMYNTAFEVIFFNDYFRQRFSDQIANSGTVFGKNPGGALWLLTKGK